VQEHIEGNRVAGVSLHSIECPSSSFGVCFLCIGLRRPNWMQLLTVYVYRAYRKNFLQVDLFYKELTQSSVSQKAAYTFENLLGLLISSYRNQDCSAKPEVVRAPSCFRCRSMSVAVVRCCFEPSDPENISFASGIEILSVTGPEL